MKWNSFVRTGFSQNPSRIFVLLTLSVAACHGTSSPDQTSPASTSTIAASTPAIAHQHQDARGQHWFSQYSGWHTVPELAELQSAASLKEKWVNRVVREC